MSSQSIACLNSLYALSPDGAIADGRYLVMSFDGTQNDTVESLLSELTRIRPQSISNPEHDIERDSDTGHVHRVSIVRSGLNIHNSFNALFNHYFPLAIKGELEEELHSKYFLFDKSYNNKPIYEKFSALQNWIVWLKKVTRNYFYEDNDSSVVFYLIETLEDDKKVKTHDITLSSEVLLNQLFNIQEMPNELCFGSDENYAAEKVLIAKSALTKTLKSSTFNFQLSQVLCSPDYLLNTFNNNYEFYIEKFSIDKFTREVETAKIEYFEKINAIIHDNQAKALSIPVVILGTSLLKSWDLMAAILILTAMILALYLVMLNLEHKIAAITDCIDSAEKALSNINDLNTEEYNLSGSTNQIRNVYEEIDNKGTSAIKLLKNIRFGTCCAALVWLIYMVCFYMNSTSSCPLS